jgi:hypothetical protein
MPDRDKLRALDKETLIELLEDAAKNWLAHDGLWFQAVEAHEGMETAIQLDAEAWERFTTIEARRIMKRHGIQEGGGLDALQEALQCGCMRASTSSPFIGLIKIPCASR